MNPYTTPPAARPWWKTTPAVLGILAFVALVAAFSFGFGFLVMIAAMVAVWVLPRWRWFAKLGATFGAFVLLTLGAGLGGQLDSAAHKTDAKAHDKGGHGVTASSSPASAQLLKAADYTSKPLDQAEKLARAAGFTPTRHDAAAEHRAVIVESGWTVCFQKVDAPAKNIDFAAVKSGEPCPRKDGDPLPWPTMPNVVGATYNAASKELKQAGIDLGSVRLDDVYLDVDAPTAEEAAEHGDEWRVCFQSPGDRTKVTSTTPVTLDLGRWTDADNVQQCPKAKNTTYKVPANDPSRKADDGSDHNSGTSGGGSSSSTGGSTSRSGGSSSTSAGATSTSGGSSSTSAGSTSTSGGSSTTSGGSASTSGGSGGGSAGTVHPGSFCSPAGATGVTTAGTPMVCGPGSDGRNRWHAA
ncbi:Stk1 family PASTA domain-containing Ser/Thr kinase [Streptomyces sp. NBC_00083]|uniref:Stk1 family PASTA domain-containing Ser/Thr kinase n=1 Tax=Streptomyces sp. NBC_00083 TaxID=2975647 RepID=UPI00225660BD|nr:Stk1 family PASTA domain-containing Ser/Thr kinase [Streptomyces sp. NBC_00083]MCX5387475.1 PASTA domain-containing protein [Streptomyces sp. NBC_00083]